MRLDCQLNCYTMPSKPAVKVPLQKPDDWYSIYDLMARFDKEYEWVYDNLVKPNLIPYRKIGSLYIWHRHHIDQWLLAAAENPNGTS